jgi:hypothetical protein
VPFGICADQRSVHLFSSGHFKGKLRGYGNVFGGEVPGKQLVDPVDGVLGDAGQDLRRYRSGFRPLSLTELTRE